MSTPLDPSKATRADFTHGYVTNVPPPPPNADPNAEPKRTRLFTAAIAFFKALGEDESMARNNLQTFSTPARDKNAQYFAWDFVYQTIVSKPVRMYLTQRYIARPGPSLSASAPEEIRIEWINACSRGNLIASLLLDERPGYLAQMVEATYPGYNSGGQPPMSNAIIEAAEEIRRVADDGSDLPWVPERGSRREHY